MSLTPFSSSISFKEAYFWAFHLQKPFLLWHLSTSLWLRPGFSLLPLCPVSTQKWLWHCQSEAFMFKGCCRYRFPSKLTNRTSNIDTSCPWMCFIQYPVVSLHRNITVSSILLCCRCHCFFSPLCAILPPQHLSRSHCLRINWHQCEFYRRFASCHAEQLSVDEKKKQQQHADLFV